MSYVVIFYPKTKEYSKILHVVIIQQDGYISSRQFSYDQSKLEDFPKDTKLFDTEEAAHQFMESWEGHPWWAKPNLKKYKVISVHAISQLVITGYRVCHPNIVNGLKKT